MEKNCDIRKSIKPNELVDVFYGFVIENEIYNKYQKKLRKSRRGELGNVTYLINEASKAKTAEAKNTLRRLIKIYNDSDYKMLLKEFEKNEKENVAKLQKA